MAESSDFQPGNESDIESSSSEDSESESELELDDSEMGNLLRTLESSVASIQKSKEDKQRERLATFKVILALMMSLYILFSF